MKTILITGGSGFIGRNLVEQLSGKYRVLAPSHRELELIDQEAVKKYFQTNNIEIVIHSATVPAHRKIDEPRDIAYKNLRLFFNLARNSQCFDRMIFLGSGAEYGIQDDIIDAKEGDFDKRVPEDEHAFAKYVCSKYIEQTDKIINLRLFGIFGKYENYQIRFISNAICKVLFDLPITLNQNRKFSYLFIDDLGPIVEHFIEHKSKEKLYNVVPAEKYELLWLAQEIKQMSGKDLEIKVKNRVMGREYTGNNKLLSKEIKHLYFTPIKESIRKLYAWYQEHKHELIRDLLLVDP